jgi:imidazolonepropionase-like amidohydrolase
MLLVAFVMAATWGPSSHAQESQTPFFVKAGRLIDGRGGAPMSPAVIRIEGDRIVAVGATLPVPSGARVIDLGNATLLPGLIDLHTHMTDKYGINWEEALVTTTPAEAALWGARTAPPCRRELRLIDRRGRRRAPVLDLRGCSDRSEPG